MSALTETTVPTAGASRFTSWRLLFNNRLAAAGFVLLVLIALVVILVPLLPLPDPDATEPANRLKPILTAGHLLGTDQLGRDILSRLLWGTRVSIAVGFAATLIAAVVGSAIGIVAGYAGGRTDNDAVVTMGLRLNLR